MIRHLLAAALVLTLAACGFQLRDALVLPPDLGPVLVNAPDRYSPLAESLAQALTRAGAEPATPDTASPAVLDIRTERWDQTPVSVDERGRAQEFSLRYAVVFELRNGDGTMVVPRQVIELSRDYISVPAASIGTEDERQVLEKELRREMTASILRRIDAVARTRGEAGAETAEDLPELEVVGTTDAARAAMEAAAALSPPSAEAVAEPDAVDPDAADPAEDDLQGGTTASQPASEPGTAADGEDNDDNDDNDGNDGNDGAPPR